MSGTNEGSSGDEGVGASGSSAGCADLDGDGVGAGTGCTGVMDCDDADATLGTNGSRSCYSGAAGTEGVGVCHGGTQTCVDGVLSGCIGQVVPDGESCDGIDNDCDGAVDQAVTRSCYDGPDGTEGVGTCAAGVERCIDGVFQGCEGDVQPTAEVCDGVDSDCDGQVDQGLTRACYTGPAGTEGVGTCQGGLSSCVNGVWAECEGDKVPTGEACDKVDNDCNGASDELDWYYSQNGTQQQLETVFRPVDVILVIDNSGSMADEIAAVENNINTRFAAVMDGSGLDYRVILLSAHGPSALGMICVKSPLSGNGDCAAPISTCPQNTGRFFHYSVNVGSHDSLSKILTTYAAPDACGLAPNGWSQWLRPEALKVFLEITDDGPMTPDKGNPNTMTAAQFTERLFQLSTTQFGSPSALSVMSHASAATEEQRDLIWHSIVGLKENSPALSPWLPTDPVVEEQCTGNGGHVVQNGLEYQYLSMQTGGVRYPICEYQSFDTVFSQIASHIIKSTEMACDFELVPAPGDPNAVGAVIEFSPSSGGTTRYFSPVADRAACAGEQFYWTAGKVFLCPGACTLWRADQSAQLGVTFTCAP